MTATLVNGQPLSRISVFDRGLSFGDGLFETLAVSNGKPCLWAWHMERLQQGCQQLRMPQPDPVLLADEAQRLLAGHEQAGLKIVITRGETQQGYAWPETLQPTRILHRFNWTPPRPGQMLNLVWCRQRLGLGSLAGIKHLNRLEQVLARGEWAAPVDEGLMCDLNGHVIEGCMSNLFVEIEGRIVTPSLKQCGIAGVVRRLVLALGEHMGLPVECRALSVAEVERADGMYLTSSLRGVQRVGQLGTHRWDPNNAWHPLMQLAARRAFEHEVEF